MEKLTGLELAQAFGDFVNTFNRDKGKEFIEGLSRQHRTLQQSSLRVMLELIEHMATYDYHTDGRNEASQKVAKKIIAGFKTEIIKEFVSQGSSLESATKDCESEFFKPSAFLPYI